MPDYYVNDRAQDNSGDHEVHKDGCMWLGMVHSKTYLGDFASCFGAVAKAKTIYYSSDGCKYCCPDCHTR
jgi:hypothetical protein